jgi:hypothetical protein
MLAPYIPRFADANFDLNATVPNRAEALTDIMDLYRITEFNIKDPANTVNFLDTSHQPNKIKQSIIDAELAGIINGYADSSGNYLEQFRPVRLPNRAEIVKMMVIAFQACNADFTYTSPLVEEYYPDLHGKPEVQATL